VGILNGYDFFKDTGDGFKAKMTELGYIEGKNINYITEKSDVSSEAYNSALDRLVDNHVDLILTFPTEASMEAKRVAKAGTPVVFSNANIDGMGLIDSIQAPGNNLTGVRYPGPDIVAKRLEVMHTLAPNAKNILVPFDKNYPTVPPQLASLRVEATKMGLTIVEAPVSTPDELAQKLASAFASHKVDAIVTIAEIVSAGPAYVEVLGKFAEAHKIPWGGALTRKKDGYAYESLFGISVENQAVGAQAAILAQKIFNGIPAGTIPVVSAESILEINYTASKAMGITPSDELLSVAKNIYR
jgi:putative ABC transport system substrate-binding protein